MRGPLEPPPRVGGGGGGGNLQWSFGRSSWKRSRDGICFPRRDESVRHQEVASLSNRDIPGTSVHQWIGASVPAGCVHLDLGGLLKYSVERLIGYTVLLHAKTWDCFR